MFILFWFVLLLFILTSIALVGLVLLQEPKDGGGMGGALGGGGGANDFSSMGGVTSGLHNLTVWLGVIWGVLALALAIIPR